MHCSRWSSFAALAATALALSAAPVALRAQTPTVTFFEGARLLGDGGVIENSAFIVANDRFFVRNHFAVPPLEARTWRLRVQGAVARELEITYDQLREMLDIVGRTVRVRAN